ncbi:MAG: hypothetical protein ACRC5C_12780 [Bacilli bacterium]
MAIAEKEVIECFLAKAQQHIDEETMHFEQRRKNMDFLNEEGISIDDALSFVYQLVYVDYFRGPTCERDARFPPGEFWEFGITEFAESGEVYVKLKEFLNYDGIMCLSFHQADYPIHYPYKSCV